MWHQHGAGLGYLVNHCQKVRFHVWIIVVKQSYKKRSPRSQSHCFKKIKIKSKWSWIELPFWTWHMKASLSLRVFNFFPFVLGSVAVHITFPSTCSTCLFLIPFSALFFTETPLVYARLLPFMNYYDEYISSSSSIIAFALKRNL